MRNTAKATTKRDINEAVAEGADASVEGPGVLFETEVVIRERGRISFDNTGPGMTLGQILDKQLADLAKHDGEARSFSFTFDDASWNDAKELYKDYTHETDPYR